MDARSRRLLGAAIAAAAALVTTRCAVKKYYPTTKEGHPHATILLYRRAADDRCEAKASPFVISEQKGKKVVWEVWNNCLEAHDVQIPYDSFHPDNAGQDQNPTDPGSPDQTPKLTVHVEKGGTDKITAKLKDSERVVATYDYRIVVSGGVEVKDPELVIWP